MNIALHGETLIISGLTNPQYGVLTTSGTFRWNRSRKTLEGAISTDNLSALGEICVLPKPLAARLASMQRRRELYEAARDEEDPKPITNYPVKVPRMFAHQIRGANMALIAFGFDPDTQTFTEGDDAI